MKLIKLRVILLKNNATSSNKMLFPYLLIKFRQLRDLLNQHLL